MTGKQVLSLNSEQGGSEELLARIEAALDRLDQLTGAESLRRTVADDVAKGSDSMALQAENSDLKARLEMLESQVASRRSAIQEVTARVDRAIGNLDTVLKG